MISSERRYNVKSISLWKVRFKNINIFRSFRVYSSVKNGSEIIRPCVLDIDRAIEGSNKPDLRKALDDTRFLVKELLFRPER